jgi:hypothetical protein
MLLLRFLVVGGLIVLAMSGLMYAFTKDRRYLQFLVVGAKFVFTLVAAILLFMVFERLVLLA